MNPGMGERVLLLGMFQISEKISLHFAWKDGRVEEWEMNSHPPSFHPSILPAAESVKRFLKHA